MYSADRVLHGDTETSMVSDFLEELVAKSVGVARDAVLGPIGHGQR
jgi:hypothetical protein